MSEKSKIQWTDATWNIARGCTKVDEDCKYCYMYRDSMNSTRYQPLEIVRTKGVFNMPLTLKEPSKIFTCSLTDFFHEAIDRYRNEAWDIIRKCPQHIFQILTKRPERIIEHLPEYWNEIKDHVWIGTSVGSQQGFNRIESLAKIHDEIDCLLFLSLEPLHGEIDLISKQVGIIHPDNEGYGVDIIKAFQWIIVGGESGNENGKYKYRPCNIEWIERIVEDCHSADIPVFVKQMGTYLAKELKMTDRHGGNIEEFPNHLQIREFPNPSTIIQ